MIGRDSGQHSPLIPGHSPQSLLRKGSRAKDSFLKALTDPQGAGLLYAPRQATNMRLKRRHNFKPQLKPIHQLSYKARSGRVSKARSRGRSLGSAPSLLSSLPARTPQLPGHTFAPRLFSFTAHISCATVLVPPLEQVKKRKFKFIVLSK